MAADQEITEAEAALVLLSFATLHHNKHQLPQQATLKLVILMGIKFTLGHLLAQ